MTDLPDYYAVLGVANTASPGEITHAYRTQLRSQHPDTHHHTGNNNDNDNDTGSDGLSAVLAAYAVLRDPARRADYDHQRQATTNTNTHAPSTTSTTPVAPPSRTLPLVRVGPVRYHGPPQRRHQ
jgi:DnaJ-class molecular chaperone